MSRSRTWCCADLECWHHLCCSDPTCWPDVGGVPAYTGIPKSVYRILSVRYEEMCTWINNCWGIYRRLGWWAHRRIMACDLSPWWPDRTDSDMCLNCASVAASMAWMDLGRPFALGTDPCLSRLPRWLCYSGSSRYSVRNNF